MQAITNHPLLSQPLYKTLWKERNVPKSEADDESIHSFFSRRLEPKVNKRNCCVPVYTVKPV